MGEAIVYMQGENFFIAVEQSFFSFVFHKTASSPSESNVQQSFTALLKLTDQPSMAN